MCVFSEPSEKLRYVSRYQEPFPMIASARKYDVLFDERPCFDALRWAFLVSTDPESRVRSFKQKLTQVCEEADCLEPTDVPKLDELIDALQGFDNSSVSETISPDICALAWPAYTRTLEMDQYWFDAQELLLLCFLDRCSIAIFLLTDSVLQRIGSHVFDDTPPVCVLLTGKRSHFERLKFLPVSSPIRARSDDRAALVSAADASAKAAADITETPSQRTCPEDPASHHEFMVDFLKGVLGYDPQKTSSAKRKKQTDASSSDTSGSSEEEGDPDVMSDDDGLIPTLEFSVDAHKYWETVEDGCMRRIEDLAAELRNRPLLPPCPHDASRPFEDVKSAIYFPSSHCAFNNCPWVSNILPCAYRSPTSHVWLCEEGKWVVQEKCCKGARGIYACCGDERCLRQHIVEAHSDILFRTCGLRASIRNSYSYYLEAIAFREQQTMPQLGPSIDRRTFNHVQIDMDEASIKGMVCMCCARIATSLDGKSNIGHVKAGEYFNGLIGQSFKLNWSFAEYSRRYIGNSDGPLVDLLFSC